MSSGTVCLCVAHVGEWGGGGVDVNLLKCNAIMFHYSSLSIFFSLFFSLSPSSSSSSLFFFFSFLFFFFFFRIS